MPLILTGTSGSTTLDSSAGLTFSDSSNQAAAASPYVLKNRIINGAMVIDQRNAGASVSITTTGSAVYTVDRWFFYVTQASKITTQQNQGSVTPPAGFSNYLGITSSSAYTPTGGDNFYVSQNIEANNISDLAWGTANAKTVTISFWVRSSLTGNFGLVVENAPTYNYSYPILYTINAANTWEYKTITIPAPTAGTWATSGNGIGFTLVFSLGIGTTYAGPSGAWAAANYNGVTGQTNVVATNGATFYITGVQLEIGTSATPFERRLYNQELANCQRYYWRFNGTGGATIFSAGGLAYTTTKGTFAIQNPVSMRVVPSAIDYASLGITLFGTSTTAVTSAILVTSTAESSLNFTVVEATVASGLTQFRPYNLSSSSASGYIAATAEL